MPKRLFGLNFQHHFAWLRAAARRDDSQNGNDSAWRTLCTRETNKIRNDGKWCPNLFCTQIVPCNAAQFLSSPLDAAHYKCVDVYSVNVHIMSRISNAHAERPPWCHCRAARAEQRILFASISAAAASAEHFLYPFHFIIYAPKCSRIHPVCTFEIWIIRCIMRGCRFSHHSTVTMIVLVAHTLTLTQASCTSYTCAHATGSAAIEMPLQFVHTTKWAKRKPYTHRCIRHQPVRNYFMNCRIKCNDNDDIDDDDAEITVHSCANMRHTHSSHNERINASLPIHAARHHSSHTTQQRARQIIAVCPGMQRMGRREKLRLRFRIYIYYLFRVFCRCTVAGCRTMHPSNGMVW